MASSSWWSRKGSLKASSSPAAQHHDDGHPRNRAYPLSPATAAPADTAHSQSRLRFQSQKPDPPPSKLTTVFSSAFGFNKTKRPGSSGIPTTSANPSSFPNAPYHPVPRPRPTNPKSSSFRRKILSSSSASSSAASSYPVTSDSDHHAERKPSFHSVLTLNEDDPFAAGPPSLSSSVRGVKSSVQPSLISSISTSTSSSEVVHLQTPPTMGLRRPSSATSRTSGAATTASSSRPPSSVRRGSKASTISSSTTNASADAVSRTLPLHKSPHRTPTLVSPSQRPKPAQSAIIEGTPSSRLDKKQRRLKTDLAIQVAEPLMVSTPDDEDPNTVSLFNVPSPFNNSPLAPLDYISHPFDCASPGLEVTRASPYPSGLTTIPTDIPRSSPNTPAAEKDTFLPSPYESTTSVHTTSRTASATISAPNVYSKQPYASSSYAYAHVPSTHRRPPSPTDSFEFIPYPQISFPSPPRKPKSIHSFSSSAASSSVDLTEVIFHGEHPLTMSPPTGIPPALPSANPSTLAFKIGRISSPPSGIPAISGSARKPIRSFGSSEADTSERDLATARFRGVRERKGSGASLKSIKSFKSAAASSIARSIGGSGGSGAGLPSTSRAGSTRARTDSTTSFASSIGSFITPNSHAESPTMSPTSLPNASTIGSGKVGMTEDSRSIRKERSLHSLPPIPSSPIVRHYNSFNPLPQAPMTPATPTSGTPSFTTSILSSSPGASSSKPPSSPIGDRPTTAPSFSLTKRLLTYSPPLRTHGHRPRTAEDDSRSLSSVRSDPHIAASVLSSVSPSAMMGWADDPIMNVWDTSAWSNDPGFAPGSTVGTAAGTVVGPELIQHIVPPAELLRMEEEEDMSFVQHPLTVIGGMGESSGSGPSSPAGSGDMPKKMELALPLPKRPLQSHSQPQTPTQAQVFPLSPSSLNSSTSSFPTMGSTPKSGSGTLPRQRSFSYTRTPNGNSHNNPASRITSPSSPPPPPDSESRGFFPSLPPPPSHNHRPRTASSVSPSRHRLDSNGSLSDHSSRPGTAPTRPSTGIPQRRPSAASTTSSIVSLPSPTLLPAPPRSRLPRARVSPSSILPPIVTAPPPAASPDRPSPPPIVGPLATNGRLAEFGERVAGARDTSGQGTYRQTDSDSGRTITQSRITRRNPGAGARASLLRRPSFLDIGFESDADNEGDDQIVPPGDGLSSSVSRASMLVETSMASSSFLDMSRPSMDSFREMMDYSLS